MVNSVCENIEGAFRPSRTHGFFLFAFPLSASHAGHKFERRKMKQHVTCDKSKEKLKGEHFTLNDWQPTQADANKNRHNYATNNNFFPFFGLKW